MFRIFFYNTTIFFSCIFFEASTKASDWKEILDNNDFQSLSQWQSKNNNYKEIPYESCKLYFTRQQSGLILTREKALYDLENISNILCWSSKENVATWIPLKISMHSAGLTASLSSIAWKGAEISNLDGKNLSSILGKYHGISFGAGLFFRAVFKIFKKKGIRIRFADTTCLTLFDLDLSYTRLYLKMKPLSSDQLLSSNYQKYVKSKIPGSRPWDQQARHERMDRDPLRISMRGAGYYEHPVFIKKYNNYVPYLVHATSELKYEDLKNFQIQKISHLRFKKIP